MQSERSTFGASLEAALVLAFFASLVFLQFRTVFSDLSGQVMAIRPGRAGSDVNLILWILSWGTHALSTAPLHLFDGNILHPAPSMLAGAEHMVGFLPLYAPIYGVSGNPVLALQITTWLAFAFNGAAMYALLRHWGCTRWAALFGGCAITASPGLYNQAFMTQLIGWFYLPIALIFLDRTLDRPSLSNAGMLSLLLSLQLLCSFYVAYISLTLLGCYLVCALVGRRTRSTPFGPAGGTIAAALGIGSALAVLGLFSIPYVTRADTGELIDHAGSWMVAMAGNRSLHTYLRNPFGPHGAGTVNGYQLGTIPLALALVAILPKVLTRTTSPAAVRCGMLFGVVACWILATGPARHFAGIPLPPLYDWLAAVAPGFSSMRAPARFALGVSFGVAALAGIGFSTMQLRLGLSPRLAGVVFLAAACATVVDYGVPSKPFASAKVPTGNSIPMVYQKLAELPPGPVLELPMSFAGLSDLRRESRYGYFSTYHWNPILNGYTGYPPWSANYLADIARTLPNERSLTTLRRLTGLRYVVLHRKKMNPFQARHWRNDKSLHLIEDFGDEVLLETIGQVEADWMDDLYNSAPLKRTWAGTPLAAIPLEDRRAALRFVGKPPTIGTPGFRMRVPVAVRNLGVRRWPALAPGSDQVVSWAARWEHHESDKVFEELDLAPLPYDIASRDAVRTVLRPTPPRRVGNYRLTIGLVQNGEWFPNPLIAESVSIQRQELVPPTT